MSGPHPYSEEVASRASRTTDQTPPALSPNLPTATTRFRPSTISPAHWSEIIMLEQAIQSFEDRFDQFMRNQSRLLEEFQQMLIDVKLAMKTLEAKLDRLEAYANRYDWKGLAEKFDAIRLDACTIRQYEDTVVTLEALLARIETIGMRTDGVEEAVTELRAMLEHMTGNVHASRSVSQSSSADADEAPASNSEPLATSSEPRRWTGLRAFFQALDDFGEQLNGFERFEDEEEDQDDIGESAG